MVEARCRLHYPTTMEPLSKSSSPSLETPHATLEATVLTQIRPTLLLSHKTLHQVKPSFHGLGSTKLVTARCIKTALSSPSQGVEPTNLTRTPICLSQTLLMDVRPLKDQISSSLTLVHLLTERHLPVVLLLVHQSELAMYSKLLLLARTIRVRRARGTILYSRGASPSTFLTIHSHAWMQSTHRRSRRNLQHHRRSIRPNSQSHHVIEPYH